MGDCWLETTAAISPAFAAWRFRNGWLVRRCIGVWALRGYLGVISSFSRARLARLFGGLSDAVNDVGIHGVSLPIRMVGVNVTLQCKFAVSSV